MKKIMLFFTTVIVVCFFTSSIFAISVGTISRKDGVYKIKQGMLGAAQSGQLAYIDPSDNNSVVFDVDAVSSHFNSNQASYSKQHATAIADFIKLLKINSSGSRLAKVRSHGLTRNALESMTLAQIAVLYAYANASTKDVQPELYIGTAK